MKEDVMDSKEEATPEEQLTPEEREQKILAKVRELQEQAPSDEEIANRMFDHFQKLLDMKAKVLSGMSFEDDELKKIHTELKESEKKLIEWLAPYAGIGIGIIELYLMSSEISQMANSLAAMKMKTTSSYMAAALDGVEATLRATIEARAGKKFDTTAYEIALNTLEGQRAAASQSKIVIASK